MKEVKLGDGYVEKMRKKKRGERKRGEYKIDRGPLYRGWRSRKVRVCFILTAEKSDSEH